MYSAHRQTGLLRLALDLCYPEGEGMLGHQTELPPGAALRLLITLPAFWLCSALPETFNLLWYTPRLHLNLKQPAPVQLCLAGRWAALIEVHVRLVFWARVLGRCFAGSFFRRFLLSVHRPVLLGRVVFLGKLHPGFGLGHNGVASGEQLLDKDTKKGK